MNSKMTTNSQLSTIEPKKTKTQTTRTGTESQKWRSYGGLSAGWERGENERKGTGNGISIIGRYIIVRGG